MHIRLGCYPKTVLEEYQVKDEGILSIGAVAKKGDARSIASPETTANPERGRLGEVSTSGRVFRERSLIC